MYTYKSINIILYKYINISHVVFYFCLLHVFLNISMAAFTH